MSHLHMSFEQVMNTPLIHVSLLISESSPHYEKKNTVELDTYYGKVTAERKFII